MSVAVCTAPNLPWLLKNWGETGNPLYPFVSTLVPSLRWSEWNTQLLWASMEDASVAMPWSHPLEAVGAVITALWRGVHSVWFSPYVVLLYAAPFVWWLAPAGSLASRLAMQVLIFTLMVIAALTWGAGRINGETSTPKQREEEKHPVPHAA